MVKEQIQVMLQRDGMVDIHGEIGRLLQRADKDGMTIRDLRSYSRTLKALDKATIAQALSKMMASGDVVLRELPTISGRGRSRVAYFWVGV